MTWGIFRCWSSLWAFSVPSSLSSFTSIKKSAAAAIVCGSDQPTTHQQLRITNYHSPLPWKNFLGLPVLASEHGKDVDNLIIYVHWLMIVLFVGWLAYFAYALFRFHRSRNPKADYVGVKSHASNYIEGAVAIVEGVLLIAVAVPLWAKAVGNFPPKTNQLLSRLSPNSSIGTCAMQARTGNLASKTCAW